MKAYLEIIIRGYETGKYLEFSDKQMKLWLNHQCSEKPVRNITNQLLGDELIKLSKTGHRGEKFYRITNYSSIKQLFSKQISLNLQNRKSNPKLIFTPFRIIPTLDQKLESYVVKLNTKKYRVDWLEPKRDYENNICPICSGKLRKFKSMQQKNSPHSLDRQCVSRCKCKFHYMRKSSSDVMAKEKSGYIRVTPKDTNTDILSFSIQPLIDKEKMNNLYKAARKLTEPKN